MIKGFNEYVNESFNTKPLPYELNYTGGDSVYTFNARGVNYKAIIAEMTDDYSEDDWWGDETVYYDMQKVADKIIDAGDTKWLYDRSNSVCAFEFIDEDEVAAGRSGEAITGKGNAYEVLSTIMDIMKHSIKDRDIDILIFHANEPSRQRVYDSLVNRVIGKKMKCKSVIIHERGKRGIYALYKIK